MALAQRLLRHTWHPEQSEATFPAVGDRVRVTLRRDMQSWQGSKLITIPAGLTYEGVAVDVDTQGFFELVDASHNRHKFYLLDSALRIEVIASVYNT